MQLPRKSNAMQAQLTNVNEALEAILIDHFGAFINCDPC